MKAIAITVVLLSTVVACTSQAGPASLTRDLESSDPVVRAATARKLGEMGDRASSAVPALIKRLDDEAPVEAVQIRGKSGAEDTIEGQTSPGAEAAKALAKIGAPAVRPLMDVLQSHPSVSSTRATDALAAIGQPAVKELVFGLHDGSAGTRFCAFRALERIGDQSLVSEAMSLIYDSNEEIRDEAARFLGGVKDRRVMDEMMSAARHSRPEVRLCAVKVASRQDGPLALQLMVTALDDADEKVRMSAFDLLADSKSRLGMEALLAALKNGHRRSSIAIALAKKKDPRLLPVLVEIAVSDSDDTVRQTIIENLGKDAVAILITNLEGSNGSARPRAAQMLGEIRDPRAVPPLISVLSHDGSDSMRWEAVRALQKINDRTTVDLLLAAFRDGDAAMKERLTEVFGEFKDSRLVDPLVEQLENQNWYSRARAAAALGKIKSTRAVWPLIAMMKKDGPRTGSSTEAAKALRQITGRDFGEDGEKWAEWWGQSQ